MVGTVLGPFSRNLPAGRTDRRHGCTSSSECSEVKKEVDNRAWGMGCCLQRAAKEGDFPTKTEIKVLRRAEETGGGLRWGRGDIGARSSRKLARLKWSEEEESLRKVGREDLDSTLHRVLPSS